jgi:hypothetical protein
MTTEVDFKLRQVIAGQDLTIASTQFKVVTLDGLIAGANAISAGGILRHGAPASASVSIVYEGLAKAHLGLACNSVGWPLKVAASGWLVPCASGDTAVGRLGQFAAASGDLAEVSVDFKSLGYFRA